ncbi:type I 3-dehydroquinate dehydratase [uncultured Metabacillus sp.]|uniref:type I 3-dehydroquinate dehydratase n=2 Tax=uncultured Metabacillus sp. TaxID=2860135 RepID=UPI00260C3608|nr:type I 3-dehydroquinate dehydratase [uncultured Metabacillus sp.]
MMERELLEKWPSICTPLTGRNTEELIVELNSIVPKKPDLIEWRADFYDQIDQFDQVIRTAGEIFKNCNGIPILFTIRSHKEGGQAIPLTEEGIVDLLSNICQTDFVKMIDFEVSNKLEHIKRLKEVSSNHQKTFILSYHNFEYTPEKPELLDRLRTAASYGADVAKLAVMPKDEKDVLALLEVTKDAQDELNIPIITMSMGGMGAISRMLGWIYGSAVTFAVGETSSAPGQIPIENLRKIIELVKESVE